MAEALSLQAEAGGGASAGRGFGAVAPATNKSFSFICVIPERRRGSREADGKLSDGLSGREIK